MAEPASNTFCVDPDRLILDTFASGTADATSSAAASANLLARKLEILSINEDDPVGCCTFVLREEDHTLGNLLRHVIMQNEAVEYCGYSIPHPSEAKLCLRVQVPLKSFN